MHNKLVPFFLLAGVTSLTFFGCGGGGGGSASSSIDSGLPSEDTVVVVPPAGGSPSNGSSSGHVITSSTISGTLVNAVTNEPMSGITMCVATTNLYGVSNSAGYFSINSVPVGMQTINLEDSLDETIATAQVLVSGATDPLGTLLLTGAGNPPPAPTF